MTFKSAFGNYKVSEEYLSSTVAGSNGAIPVFASNGKIGSLLDLTKINTVIGYNSNMGTSFNDRSIPDVGYVKTLITTSLAGSFGTNADGAGLFSSTAGVLDVNSGFGIIVSNDKVNVDTSIIATNAYASTAGNYSASSTSGIIINNTNHTISVDTSIIATNNYVQMVASTSGAIYTAASTSGIIINNTNHTVLVDTSIIATNAYASTAGNYTAANTSGIIINNTNRTILVDTSLIATKAYASTSGNYNALNNGISINNTSRTIGLDISSYTPTTPVSIITSSTMNLQSTGNNSIQSSATASLVSNTANIAAVQCSPSSVKDISQSLVVVIGPSPTFTNTTTTVNAQSNLTPTALTISQTKTITINGVDQGAQANTFQGIVYGADYSSAYTTRSLIDLGYAQTTFVSKVVSTDKAIARFNSSTGAIQNSNIILDTSLNATHLSSINGNRLVLGASLTGSATTSGTFYVHPNGYHGINSSSVADSAGLVIIPSLVGDTALKIKGLSGQTGNLLEVKTVNAVSPDLLFVKSNGTINYASSTAGAVMYTNSTKDIIPLVLSDSQVVGNFSGTSGNVEAIDAVQEWIQLPDFGTTGSIGYGLRGQKSYDDNYLYFCFQNNQWQKVIRGDVRADMVIYDSANISAGTNSIDMLPEYQFVTLTGSSMTVTSLGDTQLGRKIRIELTSANVVLANGSTSGSSGSIYVSVNANSTAVVASSPIFTAAHTGRTIEISSLRRTFTYTSSTSGTISAVLSSTIPFIGNCNLIDSFSFGTITGWTRLDAGYAFVDGVTNEVEIEIIGTTATTGSNRFRTFINPLT